MGISKRRGAYEVSVYDPAVKRKRYVGRREMLRDAKALFATKTEEFSKGQPQTQTIRVYASEWLEHHHGPDTKRPSENTRKVNEGNLRSFLAEFGDRLIDSGVGRKEALRWSKGRAHVAKTVSAMYNDAVDDEACTANPFANRKHKRSNERRNIAPITQEELDRLAEIALRHWGDDGYGQIARAWVLFSAWVGCRPGETFSVSRKDLDFAQRVVTIKRVKPPYSVDTVVLPKAAADPLGEVADRLAQTGPMFRTVTGRPMVKGSLSYHWSPIRAAFRQTVTEERWNALIDVDENSTRRDLHLYVLRHRVASVMADRGATARDIAEQLGNSPEVCERTYIHPFETDVRDRNRKLLDMPAVVDLNAVRGRKGA